MYFVPPNLKTWIRAWQGLLGSHVKISQRAGVVLNLKKSFWN